MLKLLFQPQQLTDDLFSILCVQERGLNSAPALFSDAAMRNALRKIAAMQMKQDQAPPRSRGGSRGGSAKNSHRPSVDEEHQHNRADCTGPFGRAEAARPEFGWASQQVSTPGV